MRWLGLGGQTVKNLRRLTCKFDLDQSERNSSQVNADPRKPWPNEVTSWPKFSTCVSVWPGLKAFPWSFAIEQVWTRETIKRRCASTPMYTRFRFQKLDVWIRDRTCLRTSVVPFSFVWITYILNVDISSIFHQKFHYFCVSYTGCQMKCKVAFSLLQMKNKTINFCMDYLVRILPQKET